MRIKSFYLGEIDLKITEILSPNGEILQIAPHAELEKLIYDHPKSIEMGISARHTPVVVEKDHYAFMCVISDKTGRRVEGIGESLPNTLENEIAKNYPALMAFKRAFDDAAIKFFGLPRVYSDQQIDVMAVTEKTDNSDKTVKETVKPEKDANEVSGDMFENVSDETLPWEQQEDNIEVANDLEEVINPDYPAVEQVEDEPATPATDEYDVIMTVGAMRNRKTIRECYNERPDVVHWVAETLNPRNAEQRSQKELCIQFLKMMEGEN